jgi:hypothetical protein
VGDWAGNGLLALLDSGADNAPTSNDSVSKTFSVYLVFISVSPCA